MAYKFQLGAAKLGGAITSSVGILSDGVVSGSTIDAEGALSGASISLTDASGIAGDALEDNGGALRVAAGGITNTMLSGAIQGTKLANGAVGNTQLSGNISADKLNLASGVMSSSAGELTLADGSVTNDMLSGSVAFSKLAALSSGNLLVGNGSNVAASVAMSGDITITNGGVTAIGAGKVTNSMLSGAVELSKLETVTAADIIVGNGSGVPSAVAMSGDITISNAGVTAIGAGKVTNTMLSGAIQGTKLANGAVGNTQLSGNISADKLNFNANQFSSSAGQLNLKSSISGALTFTNTITIDADLIVTGDTFSASVGTLLIEDKSLVVGDGLTALGATALGAGLYVGADTGANELASFEVASGSEIGFNFSSSLPLQAGTLSGDTAYIDQWEISSTQISGNLPITASGFSGDGSGLTGVSSDTATDLRLEGNNLVYSGSTVSAGDVKAITLLDTTSNAITVNLPQVNSGNLGKMIVLKDIGGNAAANNITLNASGTQEIDGSTTNVVIESDFGAVNLLAVSCSVNSGFGYLIF